jgi:hypothetical protein
MASSFRVVLTGATVMVARVSALALVLGSTAGTVPAAILATLGVVTFVCPRARLGATPLMALVALAGLVQVGLVLIQGRMAFVFL